jgi:hypothetical protein
MKINGWFLAWLALGAYSVVAAIGGSALCAVNAMLCGFMAGRNLPLRPND